MIRKQRLGNGLRLLSESMPDVRSVSIGVWLNRGSRDEPKRLNGISHFIEHLVFKGTASRSAREIALAMDSVGGQMDAFTSKEYTCFYAKVLDEHLPLAVDLLADIVQRPLFDAVELERERKVILEEIRMVEDSPDELVYDLFSSMFYPTSSVGRPVQGTSETVSAMSRRQLFNFFKSAYRPSNMLIVAAGNLKHARLSRLVHKAFGGLPRGKAIKMPTGRPRSSHGIVTRKRSELEQLHILMGLPAHPRRFADRYPLHVFSTVLGGTISSRLFQRIREERGLVYSVYSSVNGFRDAGFLNVSAATSPENGAEVIRLAMDELRDLGKNGPTSEELEVAKENLKGSMMLSLESTSSRMSNLARQEISFGRQPTLEETIRGVDRVTVDSVRRLASRMIEGQRMSLAAVGRVGKLKIREKDLWL